MPALTMYPIFYHCTYSNSSTLVFNNPFFLSSDSSYFSYKIQKNTGTNHIFFFVISLKIHLFFGIQYTTFWAMEVEIAS